MPYRQPDPSDPHLLVGVGLPAEAATMGEMAYVFAEEFARLGFDEGRLLRLFKNPSYRGPHQAYRALGEPAIREIVKECIQVWGRHPAVLDDPSRGGA